MASGHVNRIYRPNTWLHRPMLQNVKKTLANPEPSTHGTKRTSPPPAPMSVLEAKADVVQPRADVASLEAFATNAKPRALKPEAPLLPRAGAHLPLRSRPACRPAPTACPRQTQAACH